MNSAARKSFFHTRAGRGSVVTALVLAAFAVTHTGCSKDEAKKDDSLCSGGQALSKTGITGQTLPLKTLSLTFDDGPGLRTVELSHYLKAQGIRATFFVWGEALEADGAGPATMTALVADGHLIANHTEHHYSLTAHEPAPLNEAQVVAELTDVDKQIAPFVTNNIWLFRPPYGQWSDATEAMLSKTPMSKYVGPILWNVGGSMGPEQAADAECWKTDVNGVPVKSVQECGDLYLKEIDRVGKGIVLMHDPYFIKKNDPTSGGTYDMVQNIVPVLKTKGYKFVRLDEVPDVAALLPGGAKPDAGVDPGSSGGATSGGTDGTSGGTSGTDPCL